jgi:hypothetical protein
MDDFVVKENNIDKLVCNLIDESTIREKKIIKLKNEIEILKNQNKILKKKYDYTKKFIKEYFILFL